MLLGKVELDKPQLRGSVLEGCSYAISGAISTPSLVEISIQVVGNEGWSAEERTSSAVMKSRTGEGALKQGGCSLRLEEYVLEEW
jgi:hypothetical protein